MKAVKKLEGCVDSSGEEHPRQRSLCRGPELGAIWLIWEPERWPWRLEHSERKEE